MAAQRALGIFMIVTALVVCIPVIHQVRSGEERLRDMWGFLLFASGLFIIGIGYALLGAPVQRYTVYTGIAAALLGLLVQHRERRSDGAG